MREVHFIIHYFYFLACFSESSEMFVIRLSHYQSFFSPVC